LTTEEVANLPQKAHAVVALPVASIEQHGPHLPLYTDSLIVQEVLSRTLAHLPDDFPLWTLPLLSYGRSNEHTGFAGTVTLTSETLVRVLKEIGASIARSGFRRFVIVNGHGGNTEIIDFVIRDIRERTGMMVFALHLYLRVAVPSDGLTEAEQVYGIHAGDVETSILLRCHPELVRKDQVPASLPDHLRAMEAPPFMGPLTFAWLTHDLTESGVLGDASLATQEKGQRFLNEAAEQTAKLLRRITDFEFVPKKPIP
jgi:creatinine amidohydrolase